MEYSITDISGMNELTLKWATSVAKWVEHLLWVWKVGGSSSSWVKSKIEKLTHVASLVSIHRLSPRAGLVGPVSV